MVETTTGMLLAGNDTTHFFLPGSHAGRAETDRVWVLADSGTADANARRFATPTTPSPAPVFDAEMSSTGDYWFIDNIRITGSRPPL